jgi:hypothetical protein
MADPPGDIVRVTGSGVLTMGKVDHRGTGYVTFTPWPVRCGAEAGITDRDPAGTSIPARLTGPKRRLDLGTSCGSRA